VQGVGGDGRVLDEGGAFLEEFLGDGEFTIVLPPAITGHGDGTTVLVPAQGDDGSEGVAEVFPISRKAFGKGLS
jgi:hypothetical protein